MIPHRYGVKLHGVHDVDNRFAFGQAADIRPGEIVSGIKKPGRTVFGFFLFYQGGDIRPATDIAFAVGNPRHFVRLDMSMEIVGVDNSDIFGTGPERQ
ncbi:hypothetical protein D3C75_772470 [compost metagenome]